jgi:hypothetical protein
VDHPFCGVVENVVEKSIDDALWSQRPITVDHPFCGVVENVVEKSIDDALWYVVIDLFNYKYSLKKIALKVLQTFFL